VPGSGTIGHMDSKGATSAGFTGRASQLQVVDQVITAALHGTGCLVQVFGEAGIGKSMFCREVVSRARDSGFSTAWGSCWPEGGAPPLWPWTAILGSLDSRGTKQLLIDDPGGTALNPERFTRFVAVLDSLREWCARRPVLIIIDDIQSADPGALLLARFISRHISGLRLVLVAACRRKLSDVADSPQFGWLDSESTMVALRGFDAEETAEFLRLRGVSAADDKLLSILLRLTGGHPLHLQRIVALGSAPSSLSGPVPIGITNAILAAIERLDGSNRLTLGYSAVLGSSPAFVEAAAVAAVSVAGVHETVDSAAAAGLVTVDPVDLDHFFFTHELVREAFEHLLAPSERTEAHARAAAALSQAGLTGPGGWGRLARHAHHALSAAGRSPTDARIAIAACRTAARAMVAGFAYERAASLLTAASKVHEQSGLLDPAAALLVERAEAVLMCGRLAEARPLFDSAVNAAIAENDAIELARAALGLGGVWVNEHRTHVAFERIAGLQRKALRELPESQESLRQRLKVRIAAEHVYRGGPVEPMLTALDEARRLGDSKALAEALSLTHHGLLTATHTWDRLALAEEQIAVAAPAGDGLLALIGLCWRTVDLFHLADPRATRSLIELHDHADALGCLSVLYIADAINVMLQIRAGQLSQAEESAQRCFALGTEVGDADALAYLAAQLTTIRWFQGRESEVSETVAQLIDSPTLNPAEFGFLATAAHIDARSGRVDRARAAFSRLTRNGLAKLPDSSTWLVGMLAVVETAHLLDEPGPAREAHQLLLPFADLPIMPSLAVTCLGSVYRPLGLAALTFGDTDLGIAHLERALAANRALGHRPVTAMTMADLAAAYLARGADVDRRRATGLLTSAREEANVIQMSPYAVLWAQQLDDLIGKVATLRLTGSQWALTVGDRSLLVPDRLGMRYLAQLLANPGKAIAARELASGVGGPTLDTSPPQPVLDSRARADYRRRVNDLTSEIDQADLDGDDRRASGLRLELEAIFDELRRATGKSGRSRSFIDPGERARTAVRKAIKRAIDDVRAAEPSIGEMLNDAVVTGATCRYIDDPTHPIQWVVTH
jgi:hypothetical protein